MHEPDLIMYIYLDFVDNPTHFQPNLRKLVHMSVMLHLSNTVLITHTPSCKVNTEGSPMPMQIKIFQNVINSFIYIMSCYDAMLLKVTLLSSLLERSYQI